MMYAITNNVFGVTVQASVQSLIRLAADSRNQGRTLGAVSSSSSLTAVVMPLLSRRCSVRLGSTWGDYASALLYSVPGGKPPAGPPRPSTFGRHRNAQAISQGNDRKAH